MLLSTKQLRHIDVVSWPSECDLGLCNDIISVSISLRTDRQLFIGGSEGTGIFGADGAANLTTGLNRC